MLTSILTYIFLGVAILLALKFVHKLYPISPLKAGSIVKIYLNWFYNRTATISHNISGGVVIYDKVQLPIHYRGRFYAVGHLDDGNKIIIVRSVKLAYLAYFAEIVRKIVGTPAYEDPTIETTTPDDSNTEQSAEQEVPHGQ